MSDCTQALERIRASYADGTNAKICARTVLHRRVLRVREQGGDAMQLIEAERREYVQRLITIRSWIEEVAQEFAHADLSIEIDGEEPGLIRTSHTVRVRSAVGEEAVVLTKEEFWNEFDLFERSAAPRLQAVLKRLQPQ